ncbi:hypothetical protein E2C01_088039 [Portunus trituberculatus]|uniref:Uncharacterized protein n=1 Tax=Portunus trituberculatus TaxID=210409 RepID=A0A5B7JFM2_PORTR|nr:hypothetical protein [Portunus trituberculatus]
MRCVAEEETGRSLQEQWMAAVVQWNHARFGVQGVSKRTGSNPVHGPSVGWASSLEATVSWRMGFDIGGTLNSIPFSP